MRNLRAETLAAAMLTLAACAGAGGDDGGSGGPAVTATVEFPNLFDQDGTKVLPTYISHIISSASFPLANVTVHNGGSSATVEVIIDLPTYGEEARATVQMAQGETRTVPISPIIDYARLFANTTSLPAGVNVTVKAGGAVVFAQTYAIRISGRDTVFWNNGGQDLSGLAAALVTPQDAAGAVQQVLRGAANRFVAGTTMVGYQPQAWPAGSYTLSPGYYASEYARVLTGDSLRVVIDAVQGGVDNNFQVFIMDAANYSAFVAGQAFAACGQTLATTPGTSVNCANPTPGDYYFVYLNPVDNFSDRVVTRHRPMTKWEVTYYQTQAIFDELRSMGIVYLNLPGTGYFTSSQNVKYPVEVLSGQGANCVEGAILFASAWEALGMEPLITLSYEHGHSFAAVRCWAGSDDCVVPVETTMVGGETAFDDASSYAAFEWTNWAGDGTLRLIDVKKARAAGITPAPM